MDKSSVSDGFTPFHEAAKAGNLRVFQYLIKAFKRRNDVLNEDVKKKLKADNMFEKLANQMKNVKSLKDVLEFTDIYNMTPILVAAKYNNYEIVNFLI